LAWVGGQVSNYLVLLDGTGMNWAPVAVTCNACKHQNNVGNQWLMTKQKTELLFKVFRRGWSTRVGGGALALMCSCFAAYVFCLCTLPRMTINIHNRQSRWHWNELGTSGQSWAMHASTSAMSATNG